AATAGREGDDNGFLYGDHVYSVMSYDQKTNTVVVRNPWGDGDPNATGDKVGTTVNGVTDIGHGQYSMSFDTYAQQFSETHFSGRNSSSTAITHGEHDGAQIARGDAEIAGGVLSGDPGQVVDGAGKVVSGGQHVARDAWQEVLSWF
ncbi:MAG: hypothetical protein ACRD3W_10625, partial [Terriglobales bacterium]